MPKEITKAALEELTKIFQVLIIINDRGGSRKSTLLIMLLGIFAMANRAARGMEIDDQGRVAQVFGDMVATLILPPAEYLTKSAAADTGALAPLLNGITRPDAAVPLIIEVGANLSDRVASVLMSNRIGKLAQQSNCRIGLLTMIDAGDDTLSLGAQSAKMFKAALPSAEIIIVQPSDDLRIDLQSPRMSAAARSGYIDVVQPALAAESRIVWPMLDKDALLAFEKLRVSPGEFLQMSPELVGRAGYDPSRMDFAADDNSMFWIGQKFQSDFELHIAQLVKEVQRKLGFPLGASSV